MKRRYSLGAGMKCGPREASKLGNNGCPGIIPSRKVELWNCLWSLPLSFIPLLLSLNFLSLEWSAEALDFFFFFLVSPRGMQDLSSLTRDRTSAPCSGSVASSPLEHQGSPLGQMFLQR